MSLYYEFSREIQLTSNSALLSSEKRFHLRARRLKRGGSEEIVSCSFPSSETGFLKSGWQTCVNLLRCFASLLPSSMLLNGQISYSFLIFSKIDSACNQGRLSKAYPKHKVDAFAVDARNLVKDLDEDVFLHFENCEANAGKG